MRPNIPSQEREACASDWRVAFAIANAEVLKLPIMPGSSVELAMMEETVFERDADEC